MKKRVFALLLTALLLTGCGAPVQETEEVMPEKVPQEEPVSEPGVGLLLEMEHEVYDPSMECFTYFIRNGTDETVEFGEDYAIQHWEDGAWQNLNMKENAGWNAIGYALEPGGTSALTCGFGLYQERAEAGTYRLVKQVGDETLYATFELGDSPYTEETPYGFGPLEDLPLDYGADSATAEDVVFTGDGVTNEEAVETFLHKVGLDAACQLRTVQDYGEGAVMVIDVIYENDCFLWRMWNGGDVTEQRFSYIVTDGSALYLSNGADWESTLSYSSKKVFLVPEGFCADVIPLVEQEMGNRLEWNITRYKVWSADGQWCVGLPDSESSSPTEFFVTWQKKGGGSRGSTYDLQSWDGLETAITALEWQEDGSLGLTCETAGCGISTLRFEPEAEKLTGGF